jgi:hypothetical protein
MEQIKEQLEEIKQGVQKDDVTAQEEKTTITDEIETAIEGKEIELEDFEEVKPDEIIEDEFVEVSKFSNFKKYSSFLLLGVGCVLLYKALLNKRNSEVSDDGGQ